MIFENCTNTNQLNLIKNNFTMLNIYDYLNNFENEVLYSKDAVNFFQSYGNLVLDNYMGDNGKYRTRRFGCFEYNSNKDKLCYLGNKGFYQSAEYNSLNGE